MIVGGMDKGLLTYWVTGSFRTWTDLPHFVGSGRHGYQIHRSICTKLASTSPPVLSVKTSKPRLTSRV